MAGAENVLRAESHLAPPLTRGTYLPAPVRPRLISVSTTRLLRRYLLGEIGVPSHTWIPVAMHGRQAAGLLDAAHTIRGVAWAHRGSTFRIIAVRGDGPVLLIGSPQCWFECPTGQTDPCQHPWGRSGLPVSPKGHSDP